MAEVTSYLTADEVQAVQVLHRRAPYSITHVSHGFFSVARISGGMSYQGCHYTYIPEHDECVRDDVLKMVSKMRKAPRVEAPTQGELLKD